MSRSAINFIVGIALFLVFVWLIVSLVDTDSAKPPDQERQNPAAMVGMSMDEVRDVMGAPVLAFEDTTVPGAEYWQYSRRGARGAVVTVTVTFQDGVVASIDEQ